MLPPPRLRMSDLKAQDNELTSTASEDDDDEPVEAATNTINERLMAELEDATNKEKYGARSRMGKKLGLAGMVESERTDEARKKSIEEARNLNGVNPAVALAGGVVALAGASALWYATSWLGGFFALHPVDSDVYFVQRLSQVLRNVAIGLV